MNILHGRALVHLASALVPTLMNAMSKGAVKVTLIVFSVALFGTLPISYSLEAYVFCGSGIAYIDIIGCAFLIVDIENMESSGTMAAAQLGGRLLRVCIFARHAVLVIVDWATATSAARRASPKLEVATHLFDLTATRGSVLLAVTAAVVAGSKGGRAESIVDMAALSVLVGLSLLSMAWSLDSALVAPVEKLLGLITLGASGVLESLDKDTGELKPSRLKKDGTLIEDEKEEGGDSGEVKESEPGAAGGRGVLARNAKGDAITANDAAQNMADASAALALTSSKDDVSAHAVTQLALAMTRTLTAQIEAMALESNVANSTSSAGRGGGRSGEAAFLESGAGGFKSKKVGRETVPRTPSFDDRVEVETWYPISTNGNPMLDYLATQRHASDGHIGFTAASMKGMWDFDVLRLKTRSEVLALVYRTFETQGLLDHFGLSPMRMHKFILEVSDRYLPNHYHNLWHGADVCFTTWRFLHESECADWMTPVEVLAALLAAFGHDVGHPGVNNQFLVATSSDLALLHNDHSPLENMHSTLLAAVLRDTAVMEPLTLGEARAARRIMISAVLGTDMMHHFSQISDLRIFYEANGCLMPSHGGVPPAETMAVEDAKRRFIIDMFVHAADVGNPAKEWIAAKSWGLLVMDEFWNQGDRERELGLPLGMMNDRFTSNVAMSQLNFAEYLVFPLFLVLIELFPFFEQTGRYIADNVGHWSEVRVNELMAERQRSKVDGGGDDEDGGLGDGGSKVEQSEDPEADSDGQRTGLLSEGEKLECEELQRRGPVLHKTLTDALEHLIVRGNVEE